MIRDAKLADYVPKFFSNFIFSPMPADIEGFDFYEAQISLFNTTNNISLGYYGSQQYLNNFRNIFQRIENSERVELWIEPSLNSHIHSFHMLTLLAKIPNFQEKLFINFTADLVGSMTPDRVAQSHENSVLVTDEIFETAALYWDAYRSPNPKKWVGLLGKTSGCFPIFEKIHIRFLLQLPLEPTGLRLVDRQILKCVSRGMDKTSYVLGHVLGNQLDDVLILTDSAIWDAIFALAAAPNPVIAGMPLETFDYFSSSKINRTLRKECFDSQPQLTTYGEALLNGRGNWVDDNEMNYWWGGTHITNRSYWSFDPITEKLKEP